MHNKIDPEIISSLERKEAAYWEKCRESLISDDVEEAKKNLRWLEAYGKYKSDQIKVKDRRIIWSIGIGALCLLILGSMILFKTSVNFAGDFYVSKVSVKVDSMFRSSSIIKSKEIIIDNLDSISAVALGINVKSAAPMTMSISSPDKDIIFKDFEFGRASDITIDQQAGILNFKIKNDSLVATIYIPPQAVLTVATAESIFQRVNVGMESEFLKLFTKRADIDPIAVQFKNAQPSLLNQFQISQLNFFQQNLVNDNSITESSVMKGSIKIYETNSIHSIEEGDDVEFHNLSSGRTKITVSSDSIKVSIRAKADRLVTGAANFKNDLNPTWLEYLFHQEKLTFFWSTLVFIWGMLWSVKNLFDKTNKSI